MTTYIYSFEKLAVWTLSKKLTKTIYKTTLSFPKSEVTGMSNQMRRASISIPSNIAEGCGRSVGKDQARFYQIALSSSYELINQLIIAHELGFIDEFTYAQTRKDIQIISFQINSLYKYTMNAKNSAKPSKLL